MPAVLSIGVFDSVHLGHQSLLGAARRLADARRGEVVVLALDPHPNTILLPGSVPPRVIGPQDKRRLLLEHGADRAELLQPTRELLSQPPEAFVENVVRDYHPIAFVEGTDFRFGHKRRGDLDTLRALGATLGFDVYVLDKVQVTLSDLMQTTVSSSLVRFLVAQGRVADAERCLGRPFSLAARVVRGERRGRKLGVPTVNLDLAELAALIRPAPGVYAGSAQLDDGSTHAAAISVGDKPTFDGAAFAIEAHLLDFRGDLYGQTVTLRFARWLRDQLPFPSADQLIAQLRRDLAATRELVTIG